MSLIEAITNVVVGFLLSILVQMAIFPVLGVTMSFANNLLISIIFTAVSLARSFTLRRLFEAIRMRQAKSAERTNDRVALRNHS